MVFNLVITFLMTVGLIFSALIFVIRIKKYKKYNTELFIFQIFLLTLFFISIILLLVYSSFDDNEIEPTFVDWALLIIEIAIGVFITISILFYEHARQVIIEDHDSIRKSMADKMITSMLITILKNLKIEKNLLFNFYDIEISPDNKKIDSTWIRFKKHTHILHIENLKNIILIYHDVIVPERNLNLLQIVAVASQFYMLDKKYQDFDIKTVTREIQKLQLTLIRYYGKNIVRGQI